MIWQQIYDPIGNMVTSTLLAAIPVVVMLVALGFMHIKALSSLCVFPLDRPRLPGGTVRDDASLRLAVHADGG
jgi:hypothetical protein